MQQINDSPINAIDIETSDEIIVIPNPNQGAFIVELKGKNEINTIEVFGIDGKRLNFKSERINNSSAHIQVETPSKGGYWINVKTVDGAHYKTKFVIQ